MRGCSPPVEGGAGSFERRRRREMSKEEQIEKIVLEDMKKAPEEWDTQEDRWGKNKNRAWVCVDFRAARILITTCTGGEGIVPISDMDPFNALREKRLLELASIGLEEWLGKEE
jgi:hypothetical protein